MEFTLPPLTQESFSRWYNKKVPRNDDIDERVVYPGVKLSCSTKSRDLRSQITPEHVFVTHEVDTNVYHHKVLGSNNVFIGLPKRLYSHCFRNINIHSIPTDNRILVRLTESTSVILPFIPDDFVAQKRTKRSLSSRSRAKREKKRTKTEHTTSLSTPYSIDKFQLFNYIKEQLKINELTLDSYIPNPFAGTTTIDEINHVEEKQIALDTIIQFVHHYARNIN